MNSKERVKRAIHFTGPDRIPYHLPEPYPSDITWIFPETKNQKVEIRDGTKYRLSEWGSWWQVVSDENMGEVVEPALNDWSQYSEYKFPAVNKKSRYQQVPQIIADNSDKYIMGVLSASLFPHYWEIRGLDNFFVDLYNNVEQMEDLLDKIIELQLESVSIWNEYEVDGIVVGFDDWGLQDRLMINPEQWRQFFKPRYKRVWQKIGENDLDVILHSCGDITDILDDMSEIGLDVINMDQQTNMGLDNLSCEFGGRICFWNPADIQTVLLNCTSEEVREYTVKMMHKLGSFNGGFIGKYYPQPDAARHPEENTEASFKAFIQEGDIY